LVPVPQYPLYSAAISLFGGSLVPYYLEETENWGLDVNDLRQSVAQARYKGITVSMLWLILVYTSYTCNCLISIWKLEPWNLTENWKNRMDRVSILTVWILLVLASYLDDYSRKFYLLMKIGLLSASILILYVHASAADPMCLIMLITAN
jgi:hypothetical protein